MESIQSLPLTTTTTNDNNNPDEMPDMLIKVPGWIVLPSQTQPGYVYFYNIYSRVSRWDPPVEEPEPVTVRARHILIKFVGVRNPECKGRIKGPVQRSKAEAVEKAESLLKRITQDGESFADLAKQESDCNSYEKGGMLGSFKKTEMHVPFSMAAFALAINEISGVIQSPSGLHIIQRLE
jgi:NIMA-interacting peptidyl-prolyl cis-trans isomerase 1